ncbi:F-box protein, partial [Trifolium medium]|nr:F-box protein [Trifolium medium]
MTTTLETLSNSFGGKILILDSSNWDRWHKQMKVILEFQDVQEVVETGIGDLAADATEAQRQAHRALKKKDFKVMFFIHQCVDLANFQKIENASTSKECWDILEKGHVGDAKLKQNCGEDVTDNNIVSKVMRTLSYKFNAIVVAIGEAKDLSTMKVEELQCSLEAHVQRVNERSKERGVEQALQAQTSKKYGGNKGKGKNKYKNWGSESQNPKKDQDQSESSKNENNGKNKKSKKHIQCYNCQKYGHYASECRSQKVPIKQNNEESTANMAHNDSDSEADPLLMMAITNEDLDRKE